MISTRYYDIIDSNNLFSSKVDSDYPIYYPVTRRDEIQNRCSFLKMRCRTAAKDKMLSLEEMLLKIQPL